MVMLMVSVFCFTSPLAVAYGFHARRHAAQRPLAWAGLVFSLTVFAVFTLVMLASVLNLKESLCR